MKQTRMKGAIQLMPMESVDASTALELYRKLVTTRKAEQIWAEMLEKKEFYLMGHFGTGQEAIGVGIGHALRSDDYLLPTHRGIAEFVGKGMTQQDIWAEYFTKPEGPAHGHGGLHLSDYSLGLPGLVGSLGADFAIAAGLGLSCKLKNSQQVVVIAFGEGTSSQADLGSTMNFVKLFELPVVFAMTNNEWCEFGHYRTHVCTEHVAQRAEGYGIPWRIVDGNDVLTVYRTMKEVADQVRAGSGPYFLEFKTYRVCPHYSGDSGDYMPTEDVCTWQQLDPLALCASKLVDSGVATTDDLEAMEQEVVADIKAAIDRARSLPDLTIEEILSGVFCGEVQ